MELVDVLESPESPQKRDARAGHACNTGKGTPSKEGTHRGLAESEFFQRQQWEGVCHARFRKPYEPVERHVFQFKLNWRQLHRTSTCCKQLTVVTNLVAGYLEITDRSSLQPIVHLVPSSQSSANPSRCVFLGRGRSSALCFVLAWQLCAECFAFQGRSLSAIGLCRWARGDARPHPTDDSKGEF